MMITKSKILVFAFLSLAFQANATLFIECPEDNLGFSLFAHLNKIEVSYQGQVIKTWQNPSPDWDSHQAGSLLPSR
jgi:hypothetical protein